MKRSISGQDRIVHLAVVMVILVVPAAAQAWQDLIGRAPPDWADVSWINSAPLELGDLRGNVVLVRWWTAPDCPFCGASAAALNEWHARYAERGLSVVGFYHHKVSAPLSVDKVRQYVTAFDFEFPVGIDKSWRTLSSWWLESGKRNWTSVSFLLDRRGTIRHIHPGGVYRKGDEAYSEMEGAIIRLLAEPG